MSRHGADLAMLLLGGFRTMVDAAQAELSARGYQDVRPVHDFAIRAIAAGADNASELGRRTSVSKQAAAKTIVALLERGYAVRDVDPRDSRRKRVQVTDLGFEMLEAAEQIFDDIRADWLRRIGAAEIQGLETSLRVLTEGRPARLDTPAWLARDVGEPE